MSQGSPGARLLVVDDDRGLVRLAARTLEREGYSVSTATSGGEALAALKASQPNLLLLDLKLQDADARQVIRQLSEAGRLPEFVIITGQGDEQVAVEMMKSGARDYLVKGAEFLQILPSRVAHVLAQIEQEEKLAAAEAAFRLSEDRFRVALKHSPVVVFNQDTDLRYTWVHNESLIHPGTELLGKTDADLFPPDEADRLTQIKMRVIMTGAGLRQEVSMTSAGRRRFYDLTVEPLQDPLGVITGITGAAMDVTDRKRMEEDIVHISEIEQRRIGQDLHDGICQHLAGIELKSQSLAEALEKKSKPLAAQAERIAGHVRDVIAQSRSLARGLCPFILESEGLGSALRELAATSEVLFNVKCKFAGDPSITVPDLPAATHLYRIAQEAITNAVKHGKARNVELSLTRSDEKTVLTITDDGIGFKPAASGAPGMGLRTMQYRAGRIGAMLLVQGSPKNGTKIICFLQNSPAAENLSH